MKTGEIIEMPVIVKDMSGNEIKVDKLTFVRERTCEVELGSGETAGWWECCSCGALFDMVGALACNGKKKPNFCPSCGSKVVEICE